jgi:hypothetical protein
MQWKDLLSCFPESGCLSELRGTARFSEITARLPADPGVYVQLSEEFYRRVNGDFELLYDEPLFDEAERLEGIIRELYYFDFRTFEALLFQCDLALSDTKDSGFGTGQLAAILQDPQRQFAWTYG